MSLPDQKFAEHYNIKISSMSQQLTEFGHRKQQNDIIVNVIILLQLQLSYFWNTAPPKHIIIADLGDMQPYTVQIFVT